MNGFLWLAVVALIVLAVSVVLGGVLDVLPDDLGPDWLSLPVIAGVVAAFGLAAGAVVGLGGPVLVAVPVGLAAGVGTGWLVARVVAATMRLPTYEPLRHTDLPGRIGRVVTPIGPDQAGEILVQLGGANVKFTARSDLVLAIGTEVVVVQALTPTSVLVTDLGLDQGELLP